MFKYISVVLAYTHPYPRHFATIFRAFSHGHSQTDILVHRNKQKYHIVTLHGPFDAYALPPRWYLWTMKCKQTWFAHIMPLIENSFLERSKFSIVKSGNFGEHTLDGPIYCIFARRYFSLERAHFLLFSEYFRILIFQPFLRCARRAALYRYQTMSRPFLKKNLRKCH